MKISIKIRKSFLIWTIRKIGKIEKLTSKFENLQIQKFKKSEKVKI